MGYPMTYSRVVDRNHVQGSYVRGIPADDVWLQQKSLIAGDLRRLEQDQRDERHLQWYAEQAGVTVAQARAVLDLFFAGDF